MGQGEELPWPVIDRYLAGGAAPTSADAAAVAAWVAGHPERRAELELLQRVVRAPMAYPEMPTADAMWATMAQRLTHGVSARPTATVRIATWRRRLVVEFAGVAAMALAAILLLVPRPAPHSVPHSVHAVSARSDSSTRIGSAPASLPVTPAPAPVGAMPVSPHARRTHHAAIDSESVTSPGHPAAAARGTHASVAPVASAVAPDAADRPSAAPAAAGSVFPPEPDPPAPWGQSDAAGPRGGIALGDDYGAPEAAGSGWP